MSQLRQENPAEIYERYFVPAMFLPWTLILLKHAALVPEERVLDVACGTGIVARQAAPVVGPEGSVTAVDLNPAMLGVARSLPAAQGASIRWQEGNALALPCPDDTFDAVFCQHGLQFVPDRVRGLMEMRRVLAPGGRALVIVLQSLARHPVFEALVSATASRLSLPIATVAIPFALADRDAFRSLLVDAGFGTVDVLSVSTTVRFPDPERFIPLAVVSSAAAVPAFAQLAAPERAALLKAVHDEVEPLVRRHTEGDAVTFPMYAHLAIATK